MKSNEQSALPTDVYLSFVSSLYSHRQTLLIGMLSHVVTFMLAFAKTVDFFYFGSAIAVALIWSVRTIGMRQFDRENLAALDDNGIRRWENRYNIGGVCTTFTLGIACGYSILVSRDAFAELACISVTLGSMVSLVGRNYGSARAVVIMSLAACGPIIVGLLGVMDGFMALLAILMAPFILTTWTMARGVRENLHKNVLAAREISTIAGRFDLALNNMPHGLFMLDADSRIQVANRRACELLNLGDQARLKDCHLDAVLRYGVRHTFLEQDQAKQVLRQLGQLVHGEQSRALIPFSDNLFLEFSANRRAEGGVVLIFEDVTARVRAEKKILQMVRFDTLTGLPNRDYFGELVGNALAEHRRGGQIGFMVLDVAEFKHVNDTRGHVVGDRLLCAISQRLKKLAGDAAIAARLMGDEFVLFFPDEANRRELEERMRAVHAQMRGAYEINGFTFNISMSAGYVIADSTDFRLEDMQIKADLALFESKSRDKGSCTAFEEQMDANYLDRQKLKADLREAVETGGLSAVYQPMFLADGSRIECCEALARWTHRERGPVAPTVFIQLAEEIGVVSDITRFMLRQACLDCLTWPKHIAVSVNLSVLDLHDGTIVSTVMDTLHGTGLDPSRLHLEVTESCLMEEAAKVQTILQELRARGITIAIDDFGTGYSSLSYLDALPLDLIKIDRSFVRNIREDARRFKLLRGTVNLSRELGLKIVIEGVETRDQLALINEYKCADLVQGYVFAAPMSSVSIESLSETLAKKIVAPKRRTRRTA
ncbi:EAL domain-containing protein [Pararhizobium sp. BT-229]|uniref:putative bifunctional diguanylate cyclase/phosphodiesterase n=1 Tax=Pararhizobium sp. BT-229 TaxID=2986923 RepID=UPI0021F6AC15|nr:EAL domain-containing protein [Pararhizobium sp. BT-229]MCV9966528.1 EAL domain-containing protein [Pararhizobium sp. BT-229]